jgi:hypothetical protein
VNQSKNDAAKAVLVISMLLIMFQEQVEPDENGGHLA